MKKCEYGHYYPDHFPACPYCNPHIAEQYGGTDGETTGEFTGDETMIPEMENDYDLPTGELNDMPAGADEPADPFHSGAVVPPPAPSADKTIIIDREPGDEQTVSAVRQNRKLVGWLVSYTLDEMGHDFRLYEGKNVIGKKPGLEVPVLQDPSVSNVHATILFRNNKFLLRDEFSTNGTYLNGVMVEQDTPELHDGDIIKVGNTEFKFKVALY